MLRRANSNCCLAGTKDLSVKEAREAYREREGPRVQRAVGGVQQSGVELALAQRRLFSFRI